MNVIEKLIDPVSWFKQVGRRSKELQEMVIGVKK